jgi:D-sedoheptulose 7-phosphate isomerase
VFVEWLRGSRLRAEDAVVRILGRRRQRREEHQHEPRLGADSWRDERGAGDRRRSSGRDGGYTREVADACVLIPTVNDATITPRTRERFRPWYGTLLVSHPKLKRVETKWESTRSRGAAGDSPRLCSSIATA